MEADERNRTQQAPAITWEMLEKSLSHPNTLIRAKAIETAGRVPDARAIAALQGFLHDENPQVRTAAAEALAQACARATAETESALAQIITSGGNDELRLLLLPQAARSSGEMLLRAVISCLVEPVQAIRAAAEAALEQSPDWTLSNAASEMLPLIDAAKNFPNIGVSSAAKRWSEQLHRAQLRRTMLESGVAAVMALGEALRSSNCTMRLAAAQALRGISDSRAMPVLVEALRDSDPEVRRASALSLGHLRWQPPTPEDLAAFHVALGRWPAAIEMGAAAVDALIHVAANGDEPGQLAAIDGLAKLASLRAIPTLVNLLKSERPSVRRAAALTLKALEWLPLNTEQAIAHNVELEDWSAVVSFGAEALPSVMRALKATQSSPDRTAPILSALVRLRDPYAGAALVSYTRDGEVADAAVAALDSLLENSGNQMPEDVLMTSASLTNVIQFHYVNDPASGRPLRKGIRLVDTTSVNTRAQKEMARRRAELEATAKEAS
jgi:HEAT repeat protein